MALTAGRQFGPYVVADPIGAGGMGEVYRATDTNLKREVAIKVLPATLANDDERLARFQREAELLASLNHPNIAQIYGLERDNNEIALVLELVNGPTLADRIEQGPIAADEALTIARQIIDALDTAHACGIVHRDLKPANIKLRDDGTIKVLDFGIAKALETRTAASGTAPPQLTTPAMTEAGIVLGTAAYMSPEQARGMPVDQRADIWAFGCLLFEMLTGQPAFGGEDVTVTLARVLERGADLAALPASLPPELRRAIELCLQKDPKRRLHHVGDLRLVLDGALAGAAAQNATGDTHSGSRWRIAAAAAIVAAAAVTVAIVTAMAPDADAPAPTTRFVVRAPEDRAIAVRNPVALSPDGRRLAYVTGLDDGNQQLYLQSLNAFESSAIDGGSGALSVFFSPSGEELAVRVITNDSALLRLSVDGGTPSLLTEDVDLFGASWGEDGTLVFASFWGTPLRILRPGTTEHVPLTALNTAAGENAHIVPDLLPDGKSVLFTVWSGEPSWDGAKLAIADIETGEHRIVFEGAAAGRYVASGHLVFWRAGALWAVPFDLDTLSVTGTERRVIQDVRLNNGNGDAHYTIAKNGTIAYVSGEATAFSESLIIDRNGTELARLDTEIETGDPKFSPDGQRVAMTLYRGGSFGVGVLDRARGVLDAIWTTGDSLDPVWIDNNWLSFEASFEGDYLEYRMRADGSGAPEPLFDEPQGFGNGTATWSPDGRFLIYPKAAAGNLDLWIQEPGAGTPPRALLATPANEGEPSLSPDGMLLAYESDSAGPAGIYVRPFPDVDSRRITITNSAGQNPAWSPAGDALLYMSPEGLMEVPFRYDADGSPVFGSALLVVALTGIQNFDIAPDGQSFAIERRPIESAAREINVIVNWFDELNALFAED